MNGKAEDRPPQKSVPLDHNHPTGDEIEKPEAERVIVELEYIKSKDLNNVAEVDAVLKSLDHSSSFHFPQGRNAAYAGESDPVCREVIEEPKKCSTLEKALVAMTTHVSPALLLPKLQPCLKNRSPRIRAKASAYFSRCVPRLGIEGMREYGIEKLVQAASSQLSDQLLESQEAARTVFLELETVYKKTTPVEPEEENPEAATWPIFCQSNLSPLSAQAVLRVTNVAGVAREGLVTGS